MQVLRVNPLSEMGIGRGQVIGANHPELLRDFRAAADLTISGKFYEAAKLYEKIAARIKAGNARDRFYEMALDNYFKAAVRLDEEARLLSIFNPERQLSVNRRKAAWDSWYNAAFFAKELHRDADAVKYSANALIWSSGLAEHYRLAGKKALAAEYTMHAADDAIGSGDAVMIFRYASMVYAGLANGEYRVLSIDPDLKLIRRYEGAAHRAMASLDVKSAYGKLRP